MKFSAAIHDELLKMPPSGWREMFGKFRNIATSKWRLLYQVYLQSGAWRLNRFAALARADGKCQVCGEFRDLEVHHTTYERVGEEAPADLVALCRTCHGKQHGKGGEL